MSMNEMEREFNNLILQYTPSDIFNISYWNSDSKKYAPATVQFVQNYHKILVYSPSGTITSTSISKITNANSNSLPEIRLQVWDIEEGFIKLGEPFDAKVPFFTYTEIKTWLSRLNQPYIENRKQQLAQLKTLASELLHNPDISLMLNNYIAKLPQGLFLYPDITLEIERIFEVEYAVSTDFFFSDEIQRFTFAKVSQTVKEWQEQEQFKTQQTKSILSKNAPYLREYIKTEFRYLENFLQEQLKAQLELNKELSLVLTHLIISIAARQTFALKWINHCQENVSLDSLTSLENAANIFLDSKIIDPNNSENEYLYVCYLMQHATVFDSESYATNFFDFHNLKDSILQKKKETGFISSLTESDTPKTETSVTIDDIDLMSGSEFELFIAQLFNSLGYTATVTQYSGDQGIDVIAEKNGRKIGIQAKCYTGSVGNSAVQQVVAGKQHYHLDKALVVTNSHFTKSAIELASSNDVILWDRDMLKEKLS